MASDNNLRLAFAVDTGQFPGYGDQELFDVRQFSVQEELSGLFEVNVVAVVEHPDIFLGAFVGRAAAFRIQTPNPNAAHPVRVWAGICAHASHLHAADPGMSAYHFSIVPLLWRTTMRKNSRIFQHKSAPDIVKAVLDEWQITAKFQLNATYPAYEYCVQYGETDYAFITRLLEDAGISYSFEFNATSGAGADIVSLVFDDAPSMAKGSNIRKGALNYAGNQTPAFGALPDFCTTISVTQRVRTGKLTIRDFDFRLPPTLNLASQIKLNDSIEAVYENYEYVPGEFLWEPGKADEGAKALADKYSNGQLARSLPDAGKENTAAIALEAERLRQIVVRFHTNATDLCPGLIVGINQEATITPDHPRPDLSPDAKLLVIGTHLEGENHGEWSMTVSSVYASFPVRPERRTPKPRIYGVQSAIVVGPPGQEIWTDEFGRVRVQFHWDREGKYDDNSSCWMRVSQAWAGGGFGMITIPRVGHEVLVQFFEGDPDLPVVVGRVHNLSSPVPYPLPAQQTVSGIKSNSTPGGTGYNEIRFDDNKGHESIHIQAQQTLSTVINSSESRDVGASRSTSIGGSEQTNILGARTTAIGKTDEVDIGQRYALSVGKTTGTVISDQYVLSSTGSASIEIIGDSIFLNAKGGIHLHAGKGIEVTSAGGTVILQGGPMVRVNDASSGPPPAVTSVNAAKPPTGPGGGGPGTPPTLPQGGGSVDKPGPLPTDVNVSKPSNAVE